MAGFTGSSIWHTLAGFPPVPAEMIDAGYRDFADRWNPIIDVFDECGVRFALEVHPSEIAYDFWTTKRTLEAIGNRKGFGLQLRPEPHELAVPRSGRVPRRVRRPDLPRARQGRRRGTSTAATACFAPLGFGDLRRGWDFVSAGHGDVDMGAIVRALNAIGYDGPLSVEWEDAGMDREHGAPEALAFVRKLDFPAPDARFDAAFSSGASRRDGRDVRSPAGSHRRRR